MTATTKPPARERRPRNRPVRFSFMESLGFSNSSSVWSDAPVSPTPRGRHESPEPVQAMLADLDPEDLGSRLTGRDFRWGLLIVAVVVLGSLAGLAYWLYQQPAERAESSRAVLINEAAGLRDALPTLETFSESLVVGAELDSAELFAVDAAARALFNASGDVPDTDTETRSAAASASATTLDAVRLAGDAHAYQVAVAPILVTPELETDPNLIDLDEAARNFGDWQLRFDEVRTALPDSTLSSTTEQLDILSGDLSNLLSRYMDALRDDDQEKATVVVADLAARLDQIGEQLADSLSEVRTRVSERLVEAIQALDRIGDE